MGTFLQRILAGDCQRVWDELLELGDRIREEPVYSDALGVARETMRRARHNIETLTSRYQAVGYELGYAWMEQLADAEEESVSTVATHEAVPLTPPRPDVSDRLRELEGLVGPVPLSIYAWYEQIGEVDLVGRPPLRWWALDDSSASESGSPIGDRPLDEDLSGMWCNLDALSIWSLETAMTMADPPPSLDAAMGLSHAPVEQVVGGFDPLRGYLPLGPDAYGKYFIGGGGPHGMEVPNKGVDGEFIDGMMFVDYLRLCFRWGGLPGLANYLGNMDRIYKDIAYLTEGLLPM